MSQKSNFPESKWFDVPSKAGANTKDTIKWWKDNSHKIVRWQDGTYDWSRNCIDCHTADCDVPVHSDNYQEIGQDRLEEKENEGA